MVQLFDEELIGQHRLIQAIAFINSAKVQLTGASIAVNKMFFSVGGHLLGLCYLLFPYVCQ